ncbi:MAG TPA: M4 family metallopeptidase [Nitrososphaeraceae archaeon]|nr:M4 family metallopeptidase [Nitrososphaeraceae archaeon]
MSILRRSGLITEWYDRDITAGEEWRKAINENLEKADIILLLVSSDFIASDYCWGKETLRALERHDKQEARVVPIIVRPVDWSGAPFGKLQALPENGKAITLWSNRDSAWVNVTKGIRKDIGSIKMSIPAGQTSGGRSIIESTTQLTKKLEEYFVQRAGGQLSRVIYNARNKLEISEIEVARKEGDPPTGDKAVDEAYEWMGVTYNFFWNVYERNSLDNKGMPLEAIVHFGSKYDNAYWNGRYLVFGDGDEEIFNRFTTDLDVTANELVKGVIQYEAALAYWGQSGSLIQSVADVFSSLVKQYSLRQTVDKADWLIGTGLLASAVRGRALRSMSEPGSAYDDPRLGKDRTVGHMRNYVNTSDDNGGVQINLGIPNYAFYLIAIELGGYAWERAGRIWYESIRDTRLKSEAKFGDFAKITLANALRLYGNKSREVEAVRKGWKQVGINLKK